MATVARPRARGQGLVEFALVLPLFLFILIAIVDVGRVVWANDVLANAAREAARYAIVHGGSASTPCPVGPAGPDTRIPAASSSCPYPSPSKQAIVDVARNYANGGGTITVDVCYGAGCTGSTDAVAATNVRGTPVTVRVYGTVPMITGSMFGLASYALAGNSTMKVNH